MNNCVKPLERKYQLRDGEIVNKIGSFELVDGKKIECLGPVLSYLEFQDRMIVVLHWYHASNLFNIYRNLFCYSKEDGSLIWQVEQAYDPDTREPLDEVFKYIGLSIEGEGGTWLSLEENGSKVVKHQCDDGSEVTGQVYLNEFRYGTDKLDSMTWSQFSQEYWIDYETGKLEWFAFHQKI